MPENYPIIRFLENEIPQLYIDALSLTEYSAPKLQRYVFTSKATAAAVAEWLNAEGFSVRILDGCNLLTDAHTNEVQFSSLLCGRVP